MGAELNTAGPFARAAAASAGSQPPSESGAGGAAAPGTPPPSVDVRSLCFSHTELADNRQRVTPVLADVCLSLPPGSRCLLLGANGAGKTSLLRILAGRSLVLDGSVQICGRSPFHDTALTCSGELAYIGAHIKADVTADVPAGLMIHGVPNVDPVRRDALVELLEVDLEWSMMRVSDGQRRRVQLVLGLLHPFHCLLCDEVTVDLDVCARLDLLAFFKRETEERGATIVYATHIFDGLEAWPTHVAYMEDGVMKVCDSVGNVPELFGGGMVGSQSRLLATMEEWLRRERDARVARGGGSLLLPKAAPRSSGPVFSNRQMSHYR